MPCVNDDSTSGESVSDGDMLFDPRYRRLSGLIRDGIDAELGWWDDVVAFVREYSGTLAALDLVESAAFACFEEHADRFEHETMASDDFARVVARADFTHQSWLIPLQRRVHALGQDGNRW